jgi:hypothetical protein
MARVVSVMVTAKCLAVLYVLIYPADLDADGVGAGEFPGLDTGDEGASSFSVTAIRSSRLRARSAARTELRQAISRSPGEVG